MNDPESIDGGGPAVTVEELLHQFEDICGQTLSIDTTTGPLRQALTVLLEANDARAAEVVYDINIFEAPQPYTGKEDFFPRVSKPADSGEDWRPEVTPYPREALEYFARRAGETGNDLCRALYCDFLWSRRDWRRDRLELLKMAVSSYLQASDTAWSINDKVVADVTGLHWLRRALDLSLSVKGQIDLVRLSASKAAKYLGRTTVAGGTWTLDFLGHLAEKADKIIEYVRPSVFLGTVNRILEDQGRNLPGHHDVRCTLLGVAERWHLTLGEKEDARECRRRIARTHVEEAEQQEGSSPEGNFRAGLAYEEALTVYASLNDSQGEIAAIKPRMRACFENTRGMYNTVEQEISVNAAVVGWIVGHYSTLSLGEALMSLATDRHVIPSLAAARTYAEAREGASGFMQFADGAVYRDGLSIQRLNTKEQRLEQYTATYFILRLSVSADCLLAAVFDGLAERFPNQRLGIEEQLAQSGLFDDMRLALVRSGVNSYLTGNYIGAVHVLVFQVEGVLRDLLGSLGLSTFDYRNGQGQEATFGRVIDAVEQLDGRVEGIGEDFIALLRYFLQIDGFGPNLRNAVAHGFVKSEALTKRNTEILLLILLRISTLRYTPQSTEVASA